jgi:cytochrome c5
MKYVLTAAAIVWTAAISTRLVTAQEDRPLDPQVIAWDKGVDKIDVSAYPADAKKNYKVFSDLCSRCHTLARAVNCDFVLEDDWERYIKKMMRRGRSLIKPEDAEKAFEFAIFDSKIRKKDLYDRKLKQANGR